MRKAKAEAIEAAKRKAEQEAAELFIAVITPSAWLKGSLECNWFRWGDVVEGTRNLAYSTGPGKEHTPVCGRFYWSAGSMVSDTPSELQI